MDIIPDSRDIALGANWYPLELDRGKPFRWAEQDAIINVAALISCRHVLRIVVEPGPGVGRRPFTLVVRLSDGTELKSTTVSGRDTVKIDLPPLRPAAFSVMLRAVGGGESTPNDPRILNFRVFEAVVERFPDVLAPWATPSKGFYPLETFAETTFRWVSNDAVIALDTPRDRELAFDVEPGPGVDSKPFILHVCRPGGSDVVTADIAMRTRVRVPMDGNDDITQLILHVDGGGKTIAGDPRIMNFRVLSAT